MNEVREAIASDAPTIQALYQQLVNNPAVDVLPERIASIADDPNTALLAYDREGVIVGTVLVSLCSDVMFQWQPFAVIENVVVDVSCRNMGIGSALMRVAEAFCFRANCSKTMLLSSSERSDAHRFFTRIGFTGSIKRGFVKYRRHFSIVT